MNRKIYLLLALLLIALSLLPVSAHDAQTSAEWGTPTIDGTKEDLWNSASSINVAEEAIDTDDSMVATAKVYSLWDGKFIYFFAEVTDPVIDAELKDDAWNQDAVGFMIDYAYKREPEVSYRDLGDDGYAGYVNVPAVAGAANYPDAGTVFSLSQYKDPVQSMTVITDKGYNIEIRIPLAYKEYKAGDVIGYEICLNNGNGEGVRAGQTVWKFNDGANGNDSWQYSNNMGTLTLNAEKLAATDAPVAQTPTAPATGDASVALLILAIASASAVVVVNKVKSN